MTERKPLLYCECGWQERRSLQSPCTACGRHGGVDVEYAAAYRMGQLPKEAREVLEATRFFADQLASLLERGMGHSEVAASWRQLSQTLQDSGFWGDPLPREVLQTDPESPADRSETPEES